MPIQRCQANGKPGYKWGAEGSCYTYTEGDEASKTEAHNRAVTQGRAIEANKKKEHRPGKKKS
jgi:hypothetical protein